MMPTPEVDEDVVDPILESTPEEDDAGFAEGFDGTPTEVTPPPADEGGDPPPPAEEKKEDPPPPEYRQVTVAEWNELMAKSTEIDKIKADHARRIDTAMGKMGGIERTLNALQAATPAGYQVEVTDDIVADLNAEFPELGGMVLKALKGFAGKLKGTSTAAPDPEQIDLAAQRVVRELQAEALEEEHPGWRDVVGAPDSDNDYRKWLAKQPADYQQKLGSTISAAVISKSLAKFKAEQDAAKEVADKAAKEAAEKAAAEKAAAEKASARKQRLAAAAGAPRGSGESPPPPAGDDFESGFKTGEIHSGVVP